MEAAALREKNLTQGMVQTSLTRFREVWRAKPSTKTTNPALVPPACQAGAAETEACPTDNYAGVAEIEIMPS